jgi:hypothetical protein
MNRPGLYAVFVLAVSPVGEPGVVSVVGLEFFRCGEVEQAVQAVVVPVDVVHGQRFDVGQGAQRAGAER